MQFNQGLSDIQAEAGSRRAGALRTGAAEERSKQKVPVLHGNTVAFILNRHTQKAWLVHCLVKLYGDQRANRCILAGIIDEIADNLRRSLWVDERHRYAVCGRETDSLRTSLELWHLFSGNPGKQVFQVRRLQQQLESPRFDARYVEQITLIRKSRCALASMASRYSVCCRLSGPASPSRSIST